MSLKFKRTLKRFTTFICVLLLVIPCLYSCGGAKETNNDLSFALNTIAKENSMAKATLKGGTISFDASDFARATNLSKVDSITITKLPPLSDGELRVGSSVLTAPQTLSASSIKLLSYEPKGSIATSEFYFSVNNSSTELCCKLYVLDEKNYAPTLSNASQNALEVSTFENISFYGTLPCYDPDGDKTYIEIVSYPKKGQLILDNRETGAYRFIPNEDFTGKDSFVYVARDLYGNYSPSATVSLSIKESAVSTSYIDLVDSRYHNAAIAMTEKGIMSGTQIGSSTYFYPAREMSRAEFTSMAMQAAGITKLNDSGAKTVFADDAEIQSNFKPYIAAAYELGYIKGVEKNGKLYFEPDRAMTRAEAACLLSNMLDAATPTVTPSFSDGSDVPAWAAASVNAMTYMGVMNVIENKISPLACVTRGDAAEILWNFMRVKESD
ncbi:MAG: hypothetical protein E7678_00620 [Ruminococcaceae bacterium]|nr:hypothetical protein [Oscillospiraceae bacterium]